MQVSNGTKATSNKPSSKKQNIEDEDLESDAESIR